MTIESILRRKGTNVTTIALPRSLQAKRSLIMATDSNPRSPNVSALPLCPTYLLIYCKYPKTL
jgi:hypothetical protein